MSPEPPRLGRSALIAPLLALAVLAAACGTPTDAGELVDVPDLPQVPTQAFAAVLSPSGFAGPATYSWDPEPEEGQGTALARFVEGSLTGPISVSVGACGAVRTSVLDPAGPAPVGPFRAQAADADDYRTLTVGAALSGLIGVATDIDVYRLNGTAGEQVSVLMAANSTSLDPFLELMSPSGTRLIVNNNSGGGGDALINGYTLPSSGQYLVYAHSASYQSVGAYEIELTQGAVDLMPRPSVSSFSPASATGTLFGRDFWVLASGAGFTPQSTATANGLPRSTSYVSPTRLWIRLRGSDLGLPWPGSIPVVVSNPGPGGGASTARSFMIDFPFLGETEMESPQGEAVVEVGAPIAIRIRWTHPTDSWRVMDHMELRVHDVDGSLRARVRVTEGAGATSTLGLFDANGGLVDSGLPGEARSITHADVTLDLAGGAVEGSGQEVTMTAPLRFGSGAEGSHRLEFGIVPDAGSAQLSDVLGSLVVMPAGCAATIDGVTIVPVS